MVIILYLRYVWYCLKNVNKIYNLTGIKYLKFNLDGKSFICPRNENI